MRVESAKFLLSTLDKKQYPRDGRPEFAFAGRSNVGKSTLLNALMQRKGLAKTSATPGKTQTLNFFDINGKLYFVDLPGYGYAKVPKTLKAQWNRGMADYLTDRPPLRMVVLLVDARHAPSDNDLEMLELLEEAEAPTLIVATKVDKLKQGERHRNLKALREAFELDAEAMILPVSGISGEGVREVWKVIEQQL